MSMIARFVQVEDAEIAGFAADPASVERLFAGSPDQPARTAAVTPALEERIRANAPGTMAEALPKLAPATRSFISTRLGIAEQEMASMGSAEVLLRLMRERLGSTPAGTAAREPERPTLSLDKAWHGVHYLLSGTTEPGASIESQAVLGGTDIGDDEEGFSGYGPARYFTAEQVAAIAAALARPEIEAEAAARFNAERMERLGIYPGWTASDAGWVLGALRALRDFYADAAAHGRAIITCLV